MRGRELPAGSRPATRGRSTFTFPCLAPLVDAEAPSIDSGIDVRLPDADYGALGVSAAAGVCDQPADRSYVPGPFTAAVAAGVLIGLAFAVFEFLLGARLLQLARRTRPRPLADVRPPATESHSTIGVPRSTMDSNGAGGRPAFHPPAGDRAAVVSVKLLEFALNRDIASSKAVPRNTTIVVVAGVAVALAAILVYLAVAISADPS